MNARLTHENSASRFDPYIRELRELFISHGIKVGGTEDIVPLAITLSSPGPVCDEITSIVRSIIYREHEAIPRPEIIRLVVVAVAGSPILEPSANVRQAIHQLDQYVSEVIASLRRRSFAQDPEDVEPSLQELATPSSIGASPTEFEQGQEIEARVVKSGGELEQEDATVVPAALDLQSPKVVPPYDEPKAVDTWIALQPLSLQAQEQTGVRVLSAPIWKAPSFRIALVGSIAAMILILAGLLWRHQSPVPPVSATNPSPVVASGSVLQSNLPFNPVSSAAVNAPIPLAAPRQPKVLAANRGFVSSPGGPPILPSPGTPPRHPSQPVVQSNASAGSQAPSLPAVRSARRPQPGAGGQRVAAASAVAAGKPSSFLVSSGVMDGNLITTPTTPSYPKMANMTGIEGKVILQAVVSRNGTVVATHVLDGHRLLRGAAARAVRGWRYRPYMVRGKPTDVATIVIVDFHLPH